MATFLSEGWFDEIEADAAHDGDATPGGLVLQHVVACGEGEVCYHVRVGGGRARLARGRAADADVTFAEDYDTAASVLRGELSVATALLSGHIRVGGNLGALLAAQDQLAVTAPLSPSLRAATTFR